jgi:glycerol-3-phosphate acyltransferase PlsX
LNYHTLLTSPDSASPRLGIQKDAVKRLCRGRDTLLSRPGRGAALHLADRRYPWRNPVRGRAIKTAKDQVSGTFMPQKVRIALDAMGGDVGASVVIPGAAISLTRHPDTEFLLFGERALIEAQLAKHPAMKAVSRVIHTDVAVSMREKPSQALRRGRKSSSMWLAIEAVKKGEADVAVSAGNTGALAAMARFCLRMQRGIDRPALAAIWPTARGDSVVLDLGATIGGDAHHLVALAVMGSAMASVLFDLERPTVGLLNIGVEEIKGREEIREAAELLRAMNLPQLEYIGFVEGDGIGKGAADVIVAEGFSGNIALKASEGAARQITEFLRSAMSRTWRSRIGYLFAKNAFKALRDKLDPSKSNGSVVLGLNGIVVKSHGGTDAEGFAYAVDVGYEMVRYDLLNKINQMLNPDGSAPPSAPTAQEAVS